MKLSVARNELWRGIDTVLDAVSSKPALPVLANILLEADGDHLLLAATDLDLSIRTRIPASVEEAGSITVPARTLAEIAREWPEAQLSIVVEDERLKLTGSLGEEDGGEGAYSLSGMSADDFPVMPDTLDGLKLETESIEELDSGFLVGMINKTAFAVSRDDTRPVLNGVLWRINAEGMILVATDGHRFAHYHRALDLGDHIQGEGAEAIVPPQAFSQVVKVLGAQHELVSFTIGESQVLFDLGETQLLSRLIEGPYVDYAQVIPRGNDKQLRIASENLLPAVRRVSILSSSYTHQVHLKLKKNTIELSAASPEIGGEARETIPALYDLEEMESGYNAQYLMEILRKMETKEVLFELNNPITAALLKPMDQEEGEDYFCLLMPLRPTG